MLSRFILYFPRNSCILAQIKVHWIRYLRFLYFFPSGGKKLGKRKAFAMSPLAPNRVSTSLRCACCIQQDNGHHLAPVPLSLFHRSCYAKTDRSPIMYSSRNDAALSNPEEAHGLRNNRITGTPHCGRDNVISKCIKHCFEGIMRRERREAAWWPGVGWNAMRDYSRFDETFIDIDHPED